MKLIITCIFLSLTIISFSQETTVGLNAGFSPQNNIYLSIGGNLEYRPKNAFFSVNTDPFILFDNNNVSFAEPIYLKFIIGKKLRVSPIVGSFFRTTGNFGWLLGIHFEYVINNKFILFSKNEIYRDYRQNELPNHFGGSSTYMAYYNSLLFSFGLKMMLKK